ncbi:Protoporphyrinogen oxidase [Hypoxylon sp. FL0543]|nr:Protoporphyrinogen oxidase [Hypoxylon sp. FL0543]
MIHRRYVSPLSTQSHCHQVGAGKRYLNSVMPPRWLYHRHTLLNHNWSLGGKCNFSSDGSSRLQRRAEKIAVIGGGITGLTAAYYASKRYPSAAITLFEGSSRFGGAIESAYVPLTEGTALVCEKGPRTLRANAPRAPVTYDLVHTLGLKENLTTVPKQCSTSRTRYVLYPDRLVPIPVFNSTPVSRYIAAIPAPSTLQARQLLRLLHTLATEPLFTGMLGSLLRSICFSAPRPPYIDDESIGCFLARRYGHHLVDNLASAIVNGLYAGDIYRLSAKALLPGLWELDTRAEQGGKGRNGFLWFMSKEGRKTDAHAQRLSMASRAGQSCRREDDLIAQLRRGPAGELEKTLRDASVFSFESGLQELPYALEEALKRADNVRLYTESSVERIGDCDGRLKVSISGQTEATTQLFTHIIATTPYNHVLSASNLDNPPMATVTVMLVTLCFATPFLNRPHRGFGYLIPNSVPANQNPEHALGVIFDSDAMPDQDGQLSCTKITVVLGGHWWDGRSTAFLPTDAEGIRMARRLLQRHLGITEDPITSAVTLRRNAIPQYEVGHCEKMARFHELLLERFAGRLRVAGASYRGIGVHDCVFSARSVVEGLEIEGLTGLECFSNAEKA